MEPVGPWEPNLHRGGDGAVAVESTYRLLKIKK